jgi:RNA polymerase sigma-70 factor (ECF subfamily)
VTDDRSTPAPSPAGGSTSRGLLQRARERQPEAWQQLVDLYDPLVRHWCRRGGVAAQDVDDVVQEVFTNAFAALEKFQHRGPSDTFRGWLHGVTRYRIQDHFRRLQIQLAAAGGTDAQLLILSQPDPQPEPDAEERQLCGQLYRRALELIRTEFEDRTWQMFWQSVVGGRASAVIAADLGVSAGAVRQARSRILRRLREEIADLNIEAS